jgi:UDP-3-O-[3-hydroxymyristoyl] glucosamine N-acyltransferase
VTPAELKPLFCGDALLWPKGKPPVLHRIVPFDGAAEEGDVVFLNPGATAPPGMAGASMVICHPVDAEHFPQVPLVLLVNRPRLQVARFSRLFDGDPDAPIRTPRLVITESLACEREESGELVRFHQLGGVAIGENVECAHYATVGRGALNTQKTVIEDGVKVGQHAHIAHNCHIGEHTFVSSHVELCGSVKIGKRCWIGPGVVVKDHVTIGDDAHIGIGTVLLEDVPVGARVMNDCRVYSLTPLGT